MPEISRFFALGTESAAGFNLREHISEEEYDRYCSAARRLDVVRAQQQYALIERNFRKLGDTRAYFNNGYDVGLLDSANMNDAIFAYNSDLVNWLASTRLFLDHMERGHVSEEEERASRSRPMGSTRPAAHIG